MGEGGIESSGLHVSMYHSGEMSFLHKTDGIRISYKRQSSFFISFFHSPTLLLLKDTYLLHLREMDADCPNIFFNLRKFDPITGD